MKQIKDKAEVHGIFPEPIYISKLERNFTKQELIKINQLRKRTLPLRSNASFENASQQTSKNHYILENPALTNLKKELNKFIVDYFDKIICTSNDVTPYITQSWLNFTESNQFLQRHAHQNSFISGVLYISADKDVDSIKFFKDKYETIMLEYKDFNLFNATSWWFPVETGKVILFPSHLVHGVETKKGNNQRISLAFNIFLKGHIGSDEKIMQLKLE